MVSIEKRTLVVLGLLSILLMVLFYQVGATIQRVRCLSTCLDVLEEGWDPNEETITEASPPRIPPYDMELDRKAKRVQARLGVNEDRAREITKAVQAAAERVPDLGFWVIIRVIQMESNAVPVPEPESYTF